ncbi:MAG: 4'-phosphopantetheinyl transferase superfamily protein [Lawsonibacter sp.]|nr:4'-phosphopantetheinyl transferase superfamily protein [Lawsonibacter sp.]
MLVYGAKGLTARSQARGLLALAVREVWGLSPLPEIARGPHGKPFFPEREDLHFNLSHSGDLALCALDAAPVGGDIQLVKQWRPSLPRRVCSGGELAWLEGQPELWPAFTLLWALKEARAKESGQGLTQSIRDIQVPFPEEGPVLFDGLWFQTWSGPGWAAAVCGHSKPPEKIFEKVLDIPTV